MKKVQNHNEWNRNHVDLTRGPLSPVRGPIVEKRFRPATTQYLLTPPNSASLESQDEESNLMDVDKLEALPTHQFLGMPKFEKSLGVPARASAYRRRVGRLGRLWVDRRCLASPSRENEQPNSWRYDQDSDSDEDTPIYEVDPFDTKALRFRASIPLPQGCFVGRPGVQVLKAPVLPTDHPAGNRPALPPPQQTHNAQAPG